mmetsp:Transcript_5060/g.7671  ORF Transcript_5060/g.7671 Transcript_5060/m.7671 type:complete len:313 (-) Transcript_5060:169-1107(-)
MSWFPQNEINGSTVETHNHNNDMCLKNKYEQNTTASSTATATHQKDKQQQQQQTMVVDMNIDLTQDALHRYAIEDPDFLNILGSFDDPMETEPQHLNQSGKELSSDPSSSDTTYGTNTTEVDKSNNSQQANSSKSKEILDQQCPRGTYNLRSRDSNTPTTTNSIPDPENQTSAAIAPSKQIAKSKKKQRRRSKPKKPVEVPAFVDRICDKDILCGRGGKSNHHPGNIKYREIIYGYRAQYRSLTEKDDKTGLSHVIVAKVKREGCRFVKFDDTKKKWYIASDKIARRKTAQALREKDPPEDRCIRESRTSDL